MNKTLRQLFTAVIVLFVILGISSSIIMVNRANSPTIPGTHARYTRRTVPREAQFWRRTARLSRNPTR